MKTAPLLTTRDELAEAMAPDQLCGCFNDMPSCAMGCAMGFVRAHSFLCWLAFILREAVNCFSLHSFSRALSLDPLTARRSAAAQYGWP